VNKVFSDPQISKKENQLKHKNQVRNRLFIDSKVFEYEGLYLSLDAENIKDKRLHYFQKNNEYLEFFFYN